MKYSIADIRAEYDRLDAICGTDTSGIEIKLNNGKSRLGSFSVKKPGGLVMSLLVKPTLTITISRQVMDEESLFYDTIRHEYAHAVVYLRYPREHHVHDAVWKKVCREVGCTPRATVKNEEYKEKKRESSKYTVRCRGCGAESYYSRAGKIVTQLRENPDTRLITCRRCGGRSFELTENR